MTRLTWKRQSGYGDVVVGLLGPHRVCSIQYRCVKDKRGSFELAFNLPSVVSEYGNTQDELKPVAERVVDKWLVDAGVL